MHRSYLFVSRVTSHKSHVYIINRYATYYILFKLLFLMLLPFSLLKIETQKEIMDDPPCEEGI